MKINMMKTPQKVSNNPQDIETIIHSFKHYALEDIKFNKSRPIAAFILSICFIEQLSIFRYKFHDDKGKKPNQFIAEYMEEYKNINLYHNARHTLVHNYSSKGLFDIDNQGHKDVPYVEIDKVIHINTDTFIYYLERAFERL